MSQLQGRNQTFNILAWLFILFGEIYVRPRHFQGGRIGCMGGGEEGGEAEGERGEGEWMVRGGVGERKGWGRGE